MFALPKRFEYQPHRGDEVSLISAQKPVQDDLVLRYQQLNNRLDDLKLENEEVNLPGCAMLPCSQYSVAQYLRDISTIDTMTAAALFTPGLIAFRHGSLWRLSIGTSSASSMSRTMT